MTAGPGPASMCRAGTHPDPSSVVTNTKAGQVVSWLPTWTLWPTATWMGGRPGISWALTARTVVISSVSPFNAHFDDANQDCVVFIWFGTSAAIMGSPHDEALSGHRL